MEGGIGPRWRDPTRMPKHSPFMTVLTFTFRSPYNLNRTPSLNIELVFVPMTRWVGRGVGMGGDWGSAEASVSKRSRHEVFLNALT